MDPVRTRTSYLETLILEKMSAPTRARALAVELARCTDQLNENITHRNEALKRFQGMPHDERFARTFGLRVPEGSDNLYRDLLDGIYDFTDNSIHFSKMICDDLTAHGHRVRGAYQRCLRRGARRGVIKVPEVNWSDAEELGLMPREG
jgi:hypothetical protein